MGKYKNIMPSFDTNRCQLGEILPLETPFNVIIDISEVCNFKCIYCFRGKDDRSNWGYANKVAFMDWQLFERAVSQLKDFKEEVKQISLSNHGEPLCNRRLPDMVRHIKQRGLKSRVSIHTNAAMLDEEYARDLADSDIDRIVVSIQGLSSEKYKSVCGAEIDFENFCNNLNILYKHRKNTQIYYKIIDIALEKGEEDKFYEIFTPIGDRVFIEKMVPIWKGVELPMNKDDSEAKIRHNKYGIDFPPQECCPLIFHTIVINPGGDVYPCTQLLSSCILGNIQNNTLFELWNCKERKELLIKQCKGNNPAICRDCFILQNSVYSEKDMIDNYRNEILIRLTGGGI